MRNTKPTPTSPPSRPGSMSASATTSKRSAHWPYRIARRNWPPACPPPTTSVRSASADGITPRFLACQGHRQRGFAGCPDPELVSDEAGRRVLPHRRVVVRPGRTRAKAPRCARRQDPGLRAGTFGACVRRREQRRARSCRPRVIHEASRSADRSARCFSPRKGRRAARFQHTTSVLPVPVPGGPLTVRSSSTYRSIPPGLDSNAGAIEESQYPRSYSRASQWNGMPSSLRIAENESVLRPAPHSRT